MQPARWCYRYTLYNAIFCVFGVEVFPILGTFVSYAMLAPANFILVRMHRRHGWVRNAMMMMMMITMMMMIMMIVYAGDMTLLLITWARRWSRGRLGIVLAPGLMVGQ